MASVMQERLAGRLYRRRREDVAALLDIIELELDQQDQVADRNYAQAADMGRLRHSLIEGLAQISGHDEADVRAFLKDRRGG